MKKIMAKNSPPNKHINHRFKMLRQPQMDKIKKSKNKEEKTKQEERKKKNT